MKWEYSVIHVPELKSGRMKIIRDVLNALGEKGWELVTHDVRGGEDRFILKRPLPSKREPFLLPKV